MACLFRRILIAKICRLALPIPRATAHDILPLARSGLATLPIQVEGITEDEGNSAHFSEARLQPVLDLAGLQEDRHSCQAAVPPTLEVTIAGPTIFHGRFCWLEPCPSSVRPSDHSSQQTIAPTLQA